MSRLDFDVGEHAHPEHISNVQVQISARAHDGPKYSFADLSLEELLVLNVPMLAG